MSLRMQRSQAIDAVCARLAVLVSDLAAKPRIPHAVLRIEDGDGSLCWAGAAGEARPGEPMLADTPFHYASVANRRRSRLRQGCLLQVIADDLPLAAGGSTHSECSTSATILAFTSSSVGESPGWPAPRRAGADVGLIDRRLRDAPLRVRERPGGRPAVAALLLRAVAQSG